VLNIGGVIETASWKNIPDAVLLAWQAGQEGGNSVADVLTGKESPSGKLTMTWPNAFADHASSAEFPISEETKLDLSAFIGGKKDTDRVPERNFDYTNYREGIWVGYRWFDHENLKVSYPFGYGLSYTAFEYSNAKVENNGQQITVTVDIKNVGKTAGKEVVELYASAPGLDMPKPVQELKAYAKTKKLEPGQSETISLIFPVAELASYSVADHAWVVEAGDYKLRIGASSRDIRAELTTVVAAQTTPTTDVFHSVPFID